MIHLVYGGSGSGKSEYAESLIMACSSSDRRYYIATMEAYGEEGKKRVERHRALRAGKGFQTIECPLDIASSLSRISHPEQAAVLLECVSNLVANEMFDSAGGETQIVGRITEGIRALASRTEHLIIVSVNVFEDGTSYGEETRRYMEYLGQVNAAAAALSDHVTEVIAGIPVTVK